MKVKDLSKDLNITNKELITFLKESGYSVSSHMQNLTDEMISDANERFSSGTTTNVDTFDDVPQKPIINEEREVKHFKPDDLIPCRSVTPWSLVTIGVDRSTVYKWPNYGDIEYVSYRDLQSLRSKPIIKAPKIIIDDPDLCYQWRRDLGDTYKHFLGVEYPEEFFDLPDYKFEEMLKNSPRVIKEVLKVTAMSMIRNENYPPLSKVIMIDNILGTCIKDFL